MKVVPFLYLCIVKIKVVMIPNYLKEFKELKFAKGSFEALCEQRPLCEFLLEGCHLFLYDGIGPYLLFLRYVELYRYKGELRRKEHVYKCSKSAGASLFKRIVCDSINIV